MAKNQVLAWGDYSIEIGTAPTKHSRDVKTVYVNEDNRVVTLTGGGRGGSRTPGPGIEKAVQVGDDVIRLPAEELALIEDRSKAEHDVMAVLETIDYRQVPTERILGSKWITPRGSATGLAILTESLERTGRVAVVKWVDTSREKLGVLRPRKTPDGLALLLIELAFENDYAPPPQEALVGAIETVAVQVAAGMALVRAFARPRAGEHKVDTATDTAVDARLALVESLMPSIEDVLEGAERPEHELV